MTSSQHFHLPRSRSHKSSIRARIGLRAWNSLRRSCLQLPFSFGLQTNFGRICARLHSLTTLLLRSSSSMCSWSWSAGQRHHRTSPLLKPTLSHIRKGNLKRRVVNCSLPRPRIRLLVLGKSTCFVPSDGHQRPVVASRRPARFEPAGFGRQVSPPVGVFAEVPEHPDHKDHGEAYWNEQEHGGVNGVHHSNHNIMKG